jgi:hypothetical protein
MRVLLPITALGFQCVDLANFISLRMASLEYNASVNVIIGSVFYSATCFLLANLSIERYISFLCVKRNNWKYRAIMAFQTVLVIACLGNVVLRVAHILTPTVFPKIGYFTCAAMIALFGILSDLIFNIAMSKTKGGRR